MEQWLNPYHLFIDDITIVQKEKKITMEVFSNFTNSKYTIIKKVNIINMKFYKNVIN